MLDKEFDRQWYTNKINDLMLCGHTRDAAEKLVNDFLKLGSNPDEKNDLITSDYYTENPQKTKEREIRKRIALQEIKSFDKTSRLARINEVMSEGYTRDEALECVNWEFEHEIQKVLHRFEIERIKDVMPAKGLKSGTIDFDLSGSNVKFYKLLLKGYSEDDAKRMVQNGEDDIE